MSKVLLLGTLDTKGEEFGYLKEELEKNKIATIVMDAGTVGKPFFKPDITSEEVALAGGQKLKELQEKGDRGKSVETMMKGVAVLAGKLFDEGKIVGIMGMGGSSGTSLASSAMKAVPIGVPKLIISTVASGDTSGFVGEKDIIMLHSVADISGVNRISRTIFDNAIGAMIGMLKNKKTKKDYTEKPLITASMMGVTTDCISQARESLEKNGYEVVVFHAIGSGGKAMESLINDGLVDGVLDVTTVEMSNRLVGGVCDAGPKRMEAAGKKGIPQVVSCGGIDFVNFWTNSVPEKFKKRKIYVHNPAVTLMRTTKEENEEVAKIIAGKLNKAKGPVAFFIPLGGFSSVDAEGQIFYDPEIDKAFIESLKKYIDPEIVEIIECNNHINDLEFSTKMVDYLMNLIPVSG